MCQPCLVHADRSSAAAPSKPVTADTGIECHARYRPRALRAGTMRQWNPRQGGPSTDTERGNVREKEERGEREGGRRPRPGVRSLYTRSAHTPDPPPVSQQPAPPRADPRGSSAQRRRGISTRDTSTDTAAPRYQHMRPAALVLLRRRRGRGVPSTSVEPAAVLSSSCRSPQPAVRTRYRERAVGRALVLASSG